MSSYGQGWGLAPPQAPEPQDNAAVINAAILLRNFSADVVHNRHIRILIPTTIPVEVQTSSPLPVAAEDSVESAEAPPSSPGKTSEQSQFISLKHVTCNCPLDSTICENAAALRGIFFTAVKEEDTRVLRLFTLCCLQEKRLRSLFWAKENGNAGMTALQLAASNGMADSVEIVAEVLAGHGERIDATDEGGVTPLMMAAKAGCLDAVKVLDSFGALRSLRSALGKRASDYAEESGVPELAVYFHNPKPPSKPLMDFHTMMQRLQKMSEKMLNKLCRNAFGAWCDTAGGHLRREAELQNMTDEVAREELKAEYESKGLRRFGPRWQEDLRMREDAIRRKLCKYILDRAAENPDLVFVRLVTSARMLLDHIEREEKALRDRAETQLAAKDRATSLWKVLTKDVKSGDLTLAAVKSGDVRRPRMREEVPRVPRAHKLLQNKVAELSLGDAPSSRAHARRLVHGTWLAADGSGRLQYVEACNARGLAPSHSLLTQLASSRLVLRNLALVQRREGVHEVLLPEAEALLEALRHNRLLRRVEISSAGTKEAGGEALVAAIVESRCLQSVALHLGQLTSAAVAALRGLLLDAHCELTQLDLSDSAIGNTGAKILAQNLQANTSLREVLLKRCSIGSTGCTAVAEALRSNAYLTELDLAWNSIAAAGAKALFATVEAGATSLRSLDVSWNRLGVEGAEAIGAALAANSTLQQLDVSHCGLPAEGSGLLTEGLAQNSTLATLKLDSNPLGEKGREQVARSLQARQIRLSMHTGSSKPEPDLLFSSNQPLHDLKANASGHYRLDLALAPHRSIASYLVAQGAKKGPDSWRNESVDGVPFEFHPAFELPEQGLLELDFIEPLRKDGELMDDANCERLLGVMSKIPSAVARLEQIRQVTENYTFTSAQVLMLLSSVEDGLEREISILLLSSRIEDTRALPSVVNVLSTASRNRVIAQAGPSLFFDERYPSGRYYLRLNRRADRDVLFRLFQLAKAKPNRFIEFISVAQGPLNIPELMSPTRRSGPVDLPQLPTPPGTKTERKEIMKFRWSDNLDLLRHWAHEQLHITEPRVLSTSVVAKLTSERWQPLESEVELHRVAYVPAEQREAAEKEIVEAAKAADLQEKSEDPLSLQAKRRVREWLACLLPDGWEDAVEAPQPEEEGPVTAAHVDADLKLEGAPAAHGAGNKSRGSLTRTSSAASQLVRVPSSASAKSARNNGPRTRMSTATTKLATQGSMRATTASHSEFRGGAGGAALEALKGDGSSSESSGDDSDDDSDARSISSTEQEMLLEGWLPAAIPREALVPRPWVEVRAPSYKIKHLGPRARLRLAPEHVVCVEFVSADSSAGSKLAKTARRHRTLHSAQISVLAGGEDGERATFLWVLVEREQGEGKPKQRSWERRLFVVHKAEGTGRPGMYFLDQSGGRALQFELATIDSSKVLTERDEDFVRHPVCPFSFVVTTTTENQGSAATKAGDAKLKRKGSILGDWEPMHQDHVFATETRHECNRWMKLLVQPKANDDKDVSKSAIAEAEKMYQRIMGSEEGKGGKKEEAGESATAAGAASGEGDGGAGGGGGDGEGEEAAGAGAGPEQGGFWEQWHKVSVRIDQSLQACLDCAPPSRRRNVAVLLRENKYAKKHAKAAILIQSRVRGIRDRTEARNKQALKSFLDGVQREKQLRMLGGFDPVKSKWVTFTPISSSAPNRAHWHPPSVSEKPTARPSTMGGESDRSPLPPPKPPSGQGSPLQRAATTQGHPRTRFFTSSSIFVPEPSSFTSQDAPRFFSPIHQLVPTSGLAPPESRRSLRPNLTLLEDAGGGSPLAVSTAAKLKGRRDPSTPEAPKPPVASGAVQASVVSDGDGKDAEALAKQRREQREQRLLKEILRYKIRDLHRELRARNLPTTGLKFELIERLQEHIKQQQLQRKLAEEKAAELLAAQALAGHSAHKRDPSPVARPRSRDPSGEPRRLPGGEGASKPGLNPLGVVRTLTRSNLNPKTRASLPDISAANASGATGASPTAAAARGRPRLASVEGGVSMASAAAAALQRPVI